MIEEDGCTAHDAEKQFFRLLLLALYMNPLLAAKVYAFVRKLTNKSLDGSGGKPAI